MIDLTQQRTAGRQPMRKLGLAAGGLFFMVAVGTVAGVLNGAPDGAISAWFERNAFWGVWILVGALVVRTAAALFLPD